MIEIDENGEYFRIFNNRRIKTNCNGDVWIKISKVLYKSEIPEIALNVIKDHFDIQPVLISDIYKNFTIEIDENYVAVKTGIYNSQRYRMWNTPDEELGLSLMILGDNIIDKPIINEIL